MQRLRSFGLVLGMAALSACAASVVGGDSGNGDGSVLSGDGTGGDGRTSTGDGAVGSMDGSVQGDGFSTGDATDASRDLVYPDGPPRLDVVLDVPLRDVPMQPQPDALDLEVFVEDACPGDAGPPQRMYECDPYSPTNSCPSGEGCFPYVEYPTTPCGREVFRAQCFPVGTTPVDGPCGRGGQTCAAGLACFATGAGFRCLQLCRVGGGSPSCPRGKVCEPTDLVDFGACL